MSDRLYFRMNDFAGRAIYIIMKIFEKWIWLAVMLAMFPESLAGNDEFSLRALILEAACATAEPLAEVSYEEELLREDSDMESSGGGVAAVLGQIGKENIREAETETTAETESETTETETETAKEEQTENLSVQEAAARSYSAEELADEDFVLNQIYCVDSTTSADGLNWDVSSFLEKDFSLEQDDSGPQILIYHTHSQEEYADSVSGDASMTVQGVGERLAEILEEEYGYSVLHNTNTFDMEDGELDRSRAYTYAKEWLEETLEANPSIQVVIDLHRDSVPEDTEMTTEINGKRTAKIMIFHGLSRNSHGEIERLANPYREENLAFGFQLRMFGDALYPGLCRRNYLKGYRYNLHFAARSLLVEVGAQNNTFEEAENAMEPLARMLDLVLSPAQDGTG